MASLVDDRAKVLADVGGRPFVTHLFDQLATAGCQRVVLCTGYRGEQVRRVIGDRHGELIVEYSQEDAIAGTGGALRLAATRVDADPLLVLNGDSYCEVDLEQLVSRHRASDASATMVVTAVDDAARFGRVEFDDDLCVQGFREKTGAPDAGWINAGIYVVARDLLLAIDADRVVSLESEVLPRWVARGLQAFPVRGCFLDIGTPRSYVAAAGELRAHGVT